LSRRPLSNLIKRRSQSRNLLLLKIYRVALGVSQPKDSVQEFLEQATEEQAPVVEVESQVQDVVEAPVVEVESQVQDVVEAPVVEVESQVQDVVEESPQKFESPQKVDSPQKVEDSPEKQCVETEDSRPVEAEVHMLNNSNPFGDPPKAEDNSTVETENPVQEESTPVLAEAENFMETNFDDMAFEDFKKKDTEGEAGPSGNEFGDFNNFGDFGKTAFDSSDNNAPGFDAAPAQE
jgi:transcription termination factor NusB